MAYSAQGYRVRAEECVKLANLARDSMIQSELLRLRQAYLQIATRLERLADTEKEPPPPAD